MEKIKQFLESDKGKDILTVIIIILVGLGSFELGRLSKDGQNAGIRIEYEDQGAAVVESLQGGFLSNTSGIYAAEAGESMTKKFFASSRGSKYYSLGCSGGKTIKEENRIYFATGAEAEKAGYELSSSCR